MMIIYRARISAALWYMASFILGFLFLNNIEYFLASKLPNYWNKTSSLIKADKTVVKSEVLSRSWLNILPFPAFLTHHPIYKQEHHQFLCLSHQIPPKAFSDTTTILNSVKLFFCFKNKSFITNECISRQYIISSCLISTTLKMNPQFRWSPGVAFSRVLMLLRLLRFCQTGGNSSPVLWFLSYSARDENYRPRSSYF